MKTIKLAAVLFCLCIVLHGYSQDAKRKTRAESFFGLHFDFHATPADNQVGKTLTRAMIDSLLDAVKPDFIQVDCKGHPGYSSYPTKVGNKLASYVQDPLKLFREATAAHGVALYVHYSGVMDGRAIELHPNWAKLDAKGVPDKQETSVASAYVDSLVIPQLQELAGDYNVDGAWVDGDCWAVKRDYSPAIVTAFTAKTGIAKAPVNPTDPGWDAFTQFNRDAFKTYFHKYIDGIHKFKPGFQITGNWAYSSFMPEPVDVDVDFLSGDVANQSGVYDAAFQARCLAQQGKPWDLMSWSSSHNGTAGFSSAKSDVQLEQEAGQILSVGGGYDIYYGQGRDASILPWVVPQAATLAKFCRDRQAYCKGAQPVPQVALLYSTHDFYKYEKEVYGNSDGIAAELNGLTLGLLDKQYSVQILMEHTLTGQMSKYPVIIIPGWKELDPAFKTQLLDYVKNGGNLVLTGPGPARFFSADTKINIIDDRTINYVKLGYNGKISNVFAVTCTGQTPADAVNIGGVYTASDLRSKSVPAASIVKYGSGNIAVVYTEIGTSYLTRRTELGMDMLSDIINKISIKPLLKVEGTGFVHVNLATKDGKTYVHLVNTSGPHDNNKVYEYDDIPSLHNIKVQVPTANKPTTVSLQPGNQNIPFTYNNGVVEFTIPEVDVYNIAEISY